MKHKSNDYKLNAVDYYLTEDKSQEEVCKIKRNNKKPVAYKINKNQVEYDLEKIKKKNNREITGYLKPCQYNIIWNLSWLSFSSSMYAICKGHYNLAFIPGGVFLTSINYWREPAVSSWRRTLDVGYVNAALMYQLYKVYITNAQYAKEYYFFTGLSVLFYPIGMYYYNKKKYWKHIIYHSGLHIFANIANFILYSGNPLL